MKSLRACGDGSLLPQSFLVLAWLLRFCLDWRRDRHVFLVVGVQPLCSSSLKSARVRFVMENSQKMKSASHRNPMRISCQDASSKMGLVQSRVE